MRLDKFLSSAMGLGSRTDVKKFIKNGRVEVIGTDNPRPELSIDPEKSEVYFDGKLQKYKKFVYLMLNTVLTLLQSVLEKRLAWKQPKQQSAVQKQLEKEPA